MVGRPSLYFLIVLLAFIRGRGKRGRGSVDGVICKFNFISDFARNLKTSKTHRDKFEKDHSDVFTVESADLGNLKKIKIGHDDAGFGSGTSHLSASSKFHSKSTKYFNNNVCFSCDK